MILDDLSELFSMTEGLKNEQLNMITPVCKRSIAQTIFHLAYYESVYSSIMFRKLIFSYELSIKSFEDRDVSDLIFSDEDINKWLIYLKKERARNIELLDLYYSNMRKNKFNHEVHGELSVDDIIKKIIDHDKHHSEDIEKVRNWIKGEQ
jgi:hypothetical protein